ncbi:MAG: protein-glutamate O-methyltransferase CheR [Acidimicrobiales bacterium]|nr:protein-glutamate O-methyltransferase CheR [Acidimicrobiales bacterium]
MKLSLADQQFIRELVEARTGIRIDPTKTYLVDQRIGDLRLELGLASPQEVVETVRRNEFGPVAERVIDHLSTHETSWMRDLTPFRAMAQTILPELAEARRDKVRIWSAGCSTGQEAYSVALTIAEHVPGLAHRVEIVGTDVSRATVAKAEASVYTQTEVNRGLPAEMLTKYFERSGIEWRPNPAIRQMVRFTHHNLLTPAGALGRFDLVLLRNVIFYFEPPVIRQVLGHVGRAIVPNGLLLLGSAEVRYGFESGLSPERIGNATFLRKSPVARPAIGAEVR